MKKEVNTIPWELIRKILNIFYYVLIIGIVLIASFLIKELGVLSFFLKILNLITPVIIGLVIAWILNPLVEKITNLRVNKIVAITLVYIVLIGILLWLIIAIVPLMFSQLNELTKLIVGMFNNQDGFLNSIFKTLATIEGLDITSIRNNVNNYLNTFGYDFIANLPHTFINFATSFVWSLGKFALGLLVGFYFLLNFKETANYLYTLIPKKYLKETKTVINVIAKKLSAFVRGTSISTLVLVVLYIIGFAIGGLKSVLILSLFAGIINVIPYVGAVIGGVPLIIIAFAQSPQTGWAVLIAFIIIQLIYGNILLPLIMSKSIKIHQVTMLVGLLIFGYFWGIIGMIIAAPLMSLLKIMGKYILKQFKLFGMEDYNIESELD